MRRRLKVEPYRAAARMLFAFLCFSTFSIAICYVKAEEFVKISSNSLGTLTVGNNILNIHVENNLGSSGIGTYTITTGSVHPYPNRNVFYTYPEGSANPWSSYNTIHVVDTMRDYVTTTRWLDPDPGFTLVHLDNLSPIVTTPDPNTVMITWTTLENLQIIQVNEVLGTTLSDTRVRTTIRITNNDFVAHQVGVRFLWDLMIDGWDGAWIRPWIDATTPGTWLDTENEWISPTFQFWETSNMPVSLFSVYGSVSQPVGATFPDRIVFAHWGSAYTKAYSYTPAGIVVGGTEPTIGGQYDSCMLYYWNPTTINPGATKVVTAFITTFLRAEEPPIENIPKETISNTIQSADLNGDGRPDYIWNSGYDISFVNQVLRIEVNIQLVGDDPGDALRQQWHDGIEGIWSNKYDIVDGLYTYRIELEVNWVNVNPHHVVTVHRGRGRSNMLNWYTETDWGPQYQDEIAAHEVGHMLGLYDEYPGGALDPNTLFTTTNSLMADLGPTRSWHYEQILEWLETKSGRDLSLAQSPLPPYPLDLPIPNFSDPFDIEPPTTILTIGKPKYVADTIYVTSDTPFILVATDNPEGTGVASTAYKISNATYDSGWLPYTQPFYLNGLSDGTYTINYNSTDNAGNVEPTNTLDVILFSWNYIFEDTYGRGTILKINIDHKFLQFITPEKDYDIRNATYMCQCGRAIVIRHCDIELRLITVAVDAKLDFCIAIAWDKQTNKQYFLIDKIGKE